MLRRDDGHVLRKALEFEVKQEEARTTKKDVEDASGEGGCHESSEMESGSWRDCCWSGVNPATPIYGDKPGSKLD